MGVKILWADDEIDLLKPHIIFLEGKGYEVVTATSGNDAIDLLKEENIDLVILDENMPGLTGIETLSKIKTMNASLPIIMITKSEEEEIMESAIGGRISDYLIKPVNPNQILLSIKKNLERGELVTKTTTSGYQQEFRNIGMRLNDRLDADEWVALFKDLVYWDMELSGSDDQSMMEVLQMQKSEANAEFSKFVADNYIDWINGGEGAPLLSHNVLKSNLFPMLPENKPVFLIVIDNLRFDQWKSIQPFLDPLFRVEEEQTYYSILPTATQYARNALFAGLMPLNIQKMFPNMWRNEDDEGSKNQFEEDFLNNHLLRSGLKIKMSYNKITNLNHGKKLLGSLANLMNNDLNVIVYNFVDMLSHARTEMEVIRELVGDEPAYRSITKSWFEHSPLFDMIKEMAHRGCKVVITTDHGSIRVKEPTKIVGDRNTNTNLRYKVGKTLNYVEKDVFAVKNPEDILLPRRNVTSAFVFAKEDMFFAYPNNYNHYVNYYRDTFQHGGISLEEMIVPYVVLNPK